MKTEWSEHLIRRYVLGELKEADQTALEQDLLIDRDKFEQARAIENNLIDSYVRGEMSRADREPFEAHYLSSALHRERVAIARVFLTTIDEERQD
jgi:anti-sigma factor RsiW